MENTIVELKCAQIKMQHSKAATANLMKYAEDNKGDIICKEEHYIHQGREVGIDPNYRIYTAGEAQSRTAITIRNKEVDAMLISQLSHEDTITLEITRGDTNNISEHVLGQTETHRTNMKSR